MEPQKPTANTPRRVLRQDSNAYQASANQLQPGTGSGNPSIRGHHPSQQEQSVDQSIAAGDTSIDVNADLSDDDDESDTWTQIPGPSDQEMSDSDDDDDSVAAPVLLQIPTAILNAERNAVPAASAILTRPEIHRRYKGFAVWLCKETATEEATRHVLNGLPLAIDTAKSIQLDHDHIEDKDLDMYAFAIVIHVWQIVCIRMQHGELPPEEIGVSLTLSWTAYFLSAHSLVEQRLRVTRDELRHAVQYWEDRLRCVGRGNQWIKDRWAEDISTVDQDVVFHRNDTADRYLKAFDELGKEGVTLTIIEEEKKGEWTQLRKISEQPPEGMKFARRQIASMLYSMDTSLLKAIIQGQLPRLAEVGSGNVYRALQKTNQYDHIQPGTYMNCICDYAGLSPTPKQWLKVCEQMLKYVQNGGEYNDLAEQIDQQIHPKADWPKSLTQKGLRRYTEWRSHIEQGYDTMDTNHRNWVRYFVDQLKVRMKGQPIHAPLSVPVVEIGFSNDPHKRLRQHRHHESSNYLMNLAEAVFALEYPGSFRLQQNIVFSCFQSIHTWLSEIVITQLAQGYVQGGGGFSHETAGRSNTSSNRKVPTKVWASFELAVYADGTFEKEVRANSVRVHAEREAKERAREQREQAAGEERQRERNAASTLHAASVSHLRNLIAVEDARLRLGDALSRREM